MDNPPRRRPAAKSAQSSKLAPAPSGSSARPFLRFYHSAALRKKTLAVITSLESARDPTVHRGALADIAVELTNGGLDYFFLEPLKVAKAGFIVEQSASLGMTGVQQLMASVIRNVVGRMSGAQLLSVAKSLRQFMR
jgi:hypothetical protein